MFLKTPCWLKPRTNLGYSINTDYECCSIQCDNFESYVATQLGKAVVASSLEPEDGAFVHREMQRALRAFVMDGEMHILYTFTPVQDLSVSINWQIFKSEMEALDENGLRVMTFLGLKPAVVNKMYRKSFLIEVEILTY